MATARSKGRLESEFVKCATEGCNAEVPIAKGRNNNPHIKQTDVHCYQHRTGRWEDQ